MENQIINFANVLESRAGQSNPTKSECREDFYSLKEKYPFKGVFVVPGEDYCRIANTENGKTVVCNGAFVETPQGESSLLCYRTEGLDGNFLMATSTRSFGKSGFETNFEAYTMARGSEEAYPLPYKGNAEELFFTLNSVMHAAEQHFAGAPVQCN